MARGGRPAAGTPKGRASALDASLRRRFGEDFDVMHMMAEQAYEIHKEANKPGGDRIAKRMASVDAWNKVAPYLLPKLRSVDVDMTSKGEAIAPTEIVLKVADDQRSG